MTVYFDNSATTRPSARVIQAMTEAMQENWGNPSSLHRMGKNAERAITDAKKNVLSALGIHTVSELEAKRSLLFTASGTEANNMAILGCAYAKERNRSRRLIVSDSEHPSVMECAKKLQSDGFDVYYLSTRGGTLHADDIQTALEKEPFLVSCMTVNNETGARYDIEGLFSAVKARYPKAYTHTDAVQAFLHLPFAVKNADLISLSAHKIHGPKGIGALYVSQNVQKTKGISPVIFGGGQENGFRSGSENLPAIVGFAQACLEKTSYENTKEIKEYILSSLPLGVSANLPPRSAPHILSLCVDGIRSETVLHYLEDRDIFVSSGSACSSNTGHKSYVLLSFGLCDTQADSTLRVSMDSKVTREMADRLLDALSSAVSELIHR